MQRYSRQVALAEIGEKGQEMLANSTAAIVGLGGTGCAAAASLAGMGVGRLILVDPDVVEECNLHRQLLYRAEDIGKKKAEVAKERLAEASPATKIEIRSELLATDSASRLLANADVIVDGSDNSAARVAVNRAAVEIRKPWVYGAAEEFEGRISVFWPGKGPCYSCVMGAAKDSGCQAVLGAVPQVVGSAQALEAVKILLGVGEPLVGRLVVFDGRGGNWTELALKRNPACAVCTK